MALASDNEWSVMDGINRNPRSDLNRSGAEARAAGLTAAIVGRYIAPDCNLAPNCATMP